MNETDIRWNMADMADISSCALSIGFVLMPNFTMLALAAFLDTLRLAGDEGDRSRQVDCAWTLMSEDGRAVRASNGARIEPDGPLLDPCGFDYLTIIGGTLHDEAPLGERLACYLRHAADARVPLIGVCTGGFVLARAGLMAGRRSCVSWFHRNDFALEFPDLDAVSDRLFVVDGDRITCAGGTSVIHLASHLVERHVGSGRADKGLRIMIEERARSASAPQPLPTTLPIERVTDARIRRAVLTMERRVEHPLPIAALASAAGLCPRQFARLFRRETGLSPIAFRDVLRLVRARRLIEETDLPLAQVAFRCGFSDMSYLSRRFRAHYGVSPSSLRMPARSDL